MKKPTINPETWFVLWRKDSGFLPWTGSYTRALCKQQVSERWQMMWKDIKANGWRVIKIKATVVKL